MRRQRAALALGQLRFLEFGHATVTAGSPSFLRIRCTVCSRVLQPNDLATPSLSLRKIIGARESRQARQHLFGFLVELYALMLEQMTEHFARTYGKWRRRWGKAGEAFEEETAPLGA